MLPNHQEDSQVNRTTIPRKMCDMEIDAKRYYQLQIDSEALPAAKGRSPGNMKCEVERFERGTVIKIKCWINNMETYFTINKVSFKAFVKFMVIKIVF